MAKRVSRNGPQYSNTLLKGSECLWLGFHRNVDDYLNRRITHHFFQEMALLGHLGTINQAGLYGAEVEFPDDSEKGFARLNLNVEELLPMTTQQVEELRESISNNTQGEITVGTQTQGKTQVVSTTNSCTEKGCSFSSTSPQGLGTHRVKTHNLQSRSQERFGDGRKVVISSSGSNATKTISTTPNTRDSWKSKHDAVVKRYNRLSTKHEAVMDTLKRLLLTSKLSSD